MLGPGSVIPHVKAENFISEMVDQFNVAGIGSNDGKSSRVILIIGRNQLDITEEVFVEIAPGAMQPQTHMDAVKLKRLVFANLTMTLDSAKALIHTLQQGIDQAEASSGPES